MPRSRAISGAEDVVRYANNYVRGDFEPTGQTWGKIVDEDDGQWVYVLRNIFEERLAEGGFTNQSTILKQRRAKGWLDTEKNKLTRKKTMVVDGASARKGT